MKNSKIICLIGKSASGKDTAIEYLNKEGYEFKKGVSYTTRPPREGEINGKDYYFISEKEFTEIRSRNGFIEETSYEVNGKTWFYGFAFDEFKAPKTYIIILNPEGLKAFKNAGFKDSMIPVLLDCEEEIRRERYLKRDKNNENILSQWYARASQDEKDFEDIFELLSEFKTYTYINSNLNSKEEIAEIIKGLL